MKKLLLVFLCAFTCIETRCQTPDSVTLVSVVDTSIEHHNIHFVANFPGADYMQAFVQAFSPLDSTSNGYYPFDSMDHIAILSSSIILCLIVIAFLEFELLHIMVLLDFCLTVVTFTQIVVQPQLKKWK